MEYPIVIMALVKTHGHNLLQRNLLYTALTRAKKKVIMVGQEAAVVAAIENESIRHRNTMLASRIQACMDHKQKGEEYTTLQPLLDVEADASNYPVVRKLLFPTTKVEKDDSDSYIYE